MEDFKEKSIYKYASVDTAIKIIDSERVLLNNPDNFNDPFDVMINIDDEEINKSFDLYYNYSLQQKFTQIDLNEIRDKVLKKRILLVQNKINKAKKIEYISEVNELSRLLYQNDYDKKIEKNSFKLKISNFQNYIRNCTFITCFSYDNNSNLMWSNYGDFHRGVCIEIENKSIIFRDVTYTDKRPFFDIYQDINEILCKKVNEEKNVYGSEKTKKNIISLFCTKSKDWSYENEVRFIILIDKNQKNNINLTGITLENEKYYLNIQVKKIFIGIKARGEKMEQLIQLASEKNIPVVYMKDNKKEYLIVEDKDRNSNKEKENKVKL